MAINLFAAPNVGKTERGASIVAGSLLLFAGVKKGSWGGLGLGLTGVALIGRGLTGYCSAYQALGVRTNEETEEGSNISVPYGEGIRVDKSVTVNKARFDVYSFWRNLENLPSFMQHLERVRQTGHTKSHWVAQGPMGKVVEWDAEVINDVPGELIGWRSLPGSDVQNAGSVHFRDAAAGRGTEVKVELQYQPPGGAVGAFIAKIMGSDPGKQVEADLRRFKMMLETGETPKAQPKSQNEDAQTVEREKEADVHKASEESFPASDAPAWR